MKTAAIFCLMVSTVGTRALAQAKDTGKSDSKKPHKIEKNNVPKAVNEAFILEYPVPVYDWYGYPRFDFENEWYVYDPFLFQMESPEYYVVEFTKDKIPHKAVYNKAGKKIATHKKITAELPKPVSDAIAKSSYKSWVISKDKEEIFRDKEMDKLKVYKVEAISGKEKHHLFYSQDGTLLKDQAVK